MHELLLRVELLGYHLRFTMELKQEGWIEEDIVRDRESDAKNMAEIAAEIFTANATTTGTSTTR